jgi:hypothetical protein
LLYFASEMAVDLGLFAERGKEVQRVRGWQVMEPKVEVDLETKRRQTATPAGKQRGGKEENARGERDG